MSGFLGDKLMNEQVVCLAVGDELARNKTASEKLELRYYKPISLCAAFATQKE